MKDLNKDYSSWQYYGSCKIVNIIQMSHICAELRLLGNRVALTSGGYDPIHPGHISCIFQSGDYGKIAVLVNGDSFLSAKKGRPFMDLKTRCQIVAGLRGIDWVVPFEIENDHTVNVALTIIKPDYFTKGGDRIDEQTIPEWQTCKQNNIKVITGVGLPKFWSSSDLVKAAKQ